MLSIKRLSKKFGRQTLNEIKPAPPCSTVDHTASQTAPPTATLTLPKNDLTPCSDSVPSGNKPSIPPQHIHCPSDHTSSTMSSDSENDDGEECSHQATSTQTRDSVHSVIRKKHLPTKLKIERISSAEKRKYRHYKYSTGSSSPSSSDDEIKEAFGDPIHQHYSFVPRTSQTFSWKSLNEPKQGYPHSWNSSFSRPLKVVPIGHRKPKFFAQMSTSCTERPHLDFTKMQLSKRLVVARRPLVLRNNSKVHSFQRPPSLEVSLDISDHSFQPVLTQT